MMFYDFMPLIQHAKSDQEAQEKREQLRAQLKIAVVGYRHRSRMQRSSKFFPVPRTVK